MQKYQIQLAHTTNIPFEYEIYRAKSVSEADKNNDTVVYVSDEENKTFYYKIDGNKISGIISISKARRYLLTARFMKSPMTATAMFRKMPKRFIGSLMV